MGSSPRRARVLVSALLLAAAGAVLVGQVPRRRGRRCPSGSVAIQGTFCVDRFEGALVEELARGRTRPWSPHRPPERGRRYRAVSRSGGMPQAFISQIAARAACQNAGRRLCTSAEWVRACRGPANTVYPYGDAHVRNRCNDGRPSPVPLLYTGSDIWHERQMNDPRLNQLPNTLARGGSFRRCTNGYGARDMVGNLHEWTDDVRRGLGVFRGGYYVDTWRNGRGCTYATIAHYPGYHDFSTGFRCCADLR